MASKTVKVLEDSLAEKMRDKKAGIKEKPNESAEYGPAAFLKKLKKRGRK